MPINLDTYLGIHADALKIRGQRTELLARNLANADTPGYQARDISGGWSNPDPNMPDCEAGTDMTWSRLALL